MRSIPDQHCWDVQLERLQEDPEHEMSCVCDFLGLDYDERMMTGNNWTKVYPEYE